MKIKNRNLLYFLCSILVVILHNDYYRIYEINDVNISSYIKSINDVLCYGLTRVAIPNFLFFSGMLFFNNVDCIEDLKRKIKSRIGTVVVPFFVWNIISMLWSYTISNIPFIKNSLSVRDVFTFSIVNIYNGLFLSKYNMHNWYLAQLSIFLVVSPITYYLIKNKRLGIIFLVCIFCLYIFGISLPIYLQGFCGIYYFLGCFIGKHYYERFILFSENPKRKTTCKIVLYIFLCVVLQLFAFYENMNHMNGGIIWLIAGSAFWLLVNCLNIQDNIIFDYSYFIYLSHFIVAPCVNKIIWILLPHNSFFLLFTLLGGSIVSVIIIILVGKTIKRFLPMLWMLITGERKS